MHYFPTSDADAQGELQTLERQAGQMVRKKTAANRADDRAAIQQHLDDIQRRIRVLRHRLQR